MTAPASDPLFSLLASPDPALLRQGMELAAALGDPGWFDAFLRPIQPDPRFTLAGSPLPRWLTLWLILEAPPGSAEAARLRARIRGLQLAVSGPVFPHHPNLSALAELQELDLDGPARVDLGALGALPRLERLVLRHCRAEFAPPARLPALRILTLINSEELALDGLDAPLLEEIRMRSTRLASLSGLRAPRLREVHLDHRAQEAPPLSADFPALEVIKGRVVLDAAADLARLGGLRELDVHLRGPLPALPPGLERLGLWSQEPALTVADLPSLRSLSLHGPEKTQQARLAGLPRLSHLSLGYQKIEDLSHLSALISLGWASREPRLPPLPPGLRQLELRTPGLPEALPATLEELTVKSGKGPLSLERLRPLRRLRRLCLWDAWSLRDLAALAALPALEELRVRPEVAPHLPKLPPRARIATS